MSRLKRLGHGSTKITIGIKIWFNINKALTVFPIISMNSQHLLDSGCKVKAQVRNLSAQFRKNDVFLLKKSLFFRESAIKVSKT